MRLANSASVEAPSQTNDLRETLRSACLETHKQCLFIVSRSIGGERWSDASTSLDEAMPIILACAQLCQTLASLLQVQSKRADDVLESCRQLCQMCAEISEALQMDACRAAAFDCARLCNESLDFEFAPATC